MSDEMKTEMPEIDLSSINNLEAVEKKDPGIKKVINEPIKKKRKKSKFNFTESELVPLPSKGRLYSPITEDQDILDGFIRMNPMTLAEEEILSTPRYLKTGSATRVILDRCIESDISASDILLFDSNFLMFYLRKLSYGDEYTFEIRSNEDTFERKFEHTVKISELKFEELPDDIEEPIVVKLPKSGFTVKTLLPRLYHSEEIYKRDQNRKRTTSSEDMRIIDNYVVTTIEILDDEGEEIPKKDWEEFFLALPGIDRAELKEKTTFSTGVDEIKGIICPYTERELDITIPIGPEFFRF